MYAKELASLCVPCMIKITCAWFDQGALHRIIVEKDVESAVSFAKESIKRLLSGEVGLWHLIMTGGLWRITGGQVSLLLKKVAR